MRYAALGSMLFIYMASILYCGILQYRPVHYQDYPIHEKVYVNPYERVYEYYPPSKKRKIQSRSYYPTYTSYNSRRKHHPISMIDNIGYRSNPPVYYEIVNPFFNQAPFGTVFQRDDKQGATVVATNPPVLENNTVAPATTLSTSTVTPVAVTQPSPEPPKIQNSPATTTSDISKVLKSLDCHERGNTCAKCLVDMKCAFYAKTGTCKPSSTAVDAFMRCKWCADDPYYFLGNCVLNGFVDFILIFTITGIIIILLLTLCIFICIYKRKKKDLYEKVRDDLSERTIRRVSDTNRDRKTLYPEYRDRYYSKHLNQFKD